MRIPRLILLPLFMQAVIAGCSEEPDGGDSRARPSSRTSSEVHPAPGNLAKHGGTPTVRRTYYQQRDDPGTTNDESNDQPLGHFGTVTLDVYSFESGNEYALDADVDGISVERVYFPRGGWVDFLDCELDENLTGECVDEEGRSWEFRGESYSSPSDAVEEEDDTDDRSDDWENDDEDEDEDD